MLEPRASFNGNLSTPRLSISPASSVPRLSISPAPSCAPSNHSSLGVRAGSACMSTASEGEADTFHGDAGGLPLTEGVGRIKASSSPKRRRSILVGKIHSAAVGLLRIGFKSEQNLNLVAQDYDVDDTEMADHNDAYVRAAYKCGRAYRLKASGDVYQKSGELLGLGHSAWLGGPLCQETVGKCYLKMLHANLQNTNEIVVTSTLRAMCEIVICNKENQNRSRENGTIALCVQKIHSHIQSVARWSCHLLFVLLCNNVENQKFLLQEHTNIEAQLLEASRKEWSGRGLNDAQQLLIMIDPKYRHMYDAAQDWKEKKQEQELEDENQ